MINARTFQWGRYDTQRGQAAETLAIASTGMTILVG
jgi:hypothetical protein